MAELVDAHGLEPCGVILGGSSPLFGTESELKKIVGYSSYKKSRLCAGFFVLRTYLPVRLQPSEIDVVYQISINYVNSERKCAVSLYEAAASRRGTRYQDVRNIISSD